MTHLELLEVLDSINSLLNDDDGTVLEVVKLFAIDGRLDAASPELAVLQRAVLE